MSALCTSVAQLDNAGMPHGVGEAGAGIDQEELRNVSRTIGCLSFVRTSGDDLSPVRVFLALTMLCY